MNSLQARPAIANLHVDPQAFYSAYFKEPPKSPCSHILLKVVESHRWTRSPEGVVRDGTPLLQTCLSAFPGLKPSTLSGIAGHFTIELTEDCDRNALAKFLESQDCILGAMPIPSQHCALATDLITLYVLTSRVEDCIKDCDLLRQVGVSFQKRQVSTHKELCSISVHFGVDLSLPEVFLKIAKLAENPKYGIVRFEPEDLGMGCRKRLWQNAVDEYKLKHHIP